MLDTRNVEAKKLEPAASTEHAHRAYFVSLLVVGCAAAGLYFWGRDLHRFTQWLAAYIGLYLGQLALYAVACWVVWRWPHRGTRSHKLLRALVIVTFALAFRLVLVGQRPFLSADVYRYIWDGRVQAAGISPYRYVPNDPHLARLRDVQIFESIPISDRDWISPYPPVAQAVFSLAYRIRPSSVATFKVTMSIFDLIAMLTLMLVLSRMGQEPARVVIFAWHPLLIFESAHSGHVEAVYIALAALALAAWSLRRHVVAGALLAAAALVKFYPALLLPAFLGDGDTVRYSTLRQLTKAREVMSRLRTRVFRRSSLSVISGFLVAGVVLWLPYSGAGNRILGFVGGYVADEGFAGSGSRYFLLELVRYFVPFPTQMFLIIAVVVLLFAAGRALLRTKAQVTDLASACLGLVGTYLTMTSPRYAWYYAWLLPFLCVAPSVGWLFLASASALLYLVWYTPLVYPNIPLWLGCGVYLPALGLLAWRSWRPPTRP
jgi:alpha-1,6-mannosyltransferase